MSKGPPGNGKGPPGKGPPVAEPEEGEDAHVHAEETPEVINQRWSNEGSQKRMTAAGVTVFHAKA